MIRRIGVDSSWANALVAATALIRRSRRLQGVLVRCQATDRNKPVSDCVRLQSTRKSRSARLQFKAVSNAQQSLSWNVCDRRRLMHELYPKVSNRSVPCC